MLPTLVACSHGTSSPDGQRAVAALVRAVAVRRPDLEVRAAFVDVEEPSVTAVLDQLTGRPSRVVPLLLSAGYHVYVDLAAAIATAPDATLAGALGPDPRLSALLSARLEPVGLRADDVVILAAAGSSDPRAVRDCAEVADALGQRLARPVSTAYLSAAQPRLDAVVRGAREDGRRAVVATYLLAPGYFADQAAASGADVVTAPLLLPDEPVPGALVELVLERFAG